MVTNWILNVLASTASFLIGLLPTWSLPDWMTSVSGTIGSLVSMGSQFGWWVPLSAMSDVVVAFLALSGITLAIRFFRIGLSLFTGGGGSAA